MSRVGDIPKSSLSSVAPNSNGTIAVLFSYLDPATSRREINLRFREHIFYQARSIPFRTSFNLKMQQTTCDESSKLSDSRPKASAAPNGEMRPRALVLREPRHANGLGIEDGARAGVQALVAQGWRSVSFLHGIGTLCAILIGDSASPLLQEAQGRLIRNQPRAVTRLFERSFGGERNLTTGRC
jgi:hypothetical protein